MNRYSLYLCSNLSCDISVVPHVTGEYVLYKDAEQIIGDLNIKILKLEERVGDLGWSLSAQRERLG